MTKVMVLINIKSYIWLCLKGFWGEYF